MEEEKPWYADMPGAEEERLYEESVNRIRSAVNDSSMSFEQAASLVEVKDEALRAAILDDALKVLIAEAHFAGGRPLKELALTLKLPLKRLDQARKEMLHEVEQAAIEEYKTDAGNAGNA